MRVVVIAVALAALAGCGFSPMYAPAAGGGGAVIGPVSIPEVQGKSGHAFRTELSRLLDAERGRGPTRRLDVTVTESVSQLGLRVDESATRADLVLNGAYTFFDVNDSALVRGSVVAVASYDIPVSAFGAAAAQDDARERAGVMLAQKMRTDLALRLARAARGSAPAAVQTLPAEPAPEPAGLPAAQTLPGGPVTAQQPKR